MHFTQEFGGLHLPLNLASPKRDEKEHVASGGRAFVGPAPFEPGPKGHPHGMPPGLAKKHQVPTLPIAWFDDDDDKGKGKSKGKGKGKNKK